MWKWEALHWPCTCCVSLRRLSLMTEAARAAGPGPKPPCHPRLTWPSLPSPKGGRGTEGGRPPWLQCSPPPSLWAAGSLRGL